MDEELKKVVNANPLVLVDFYADWCEPCKLVVPVLDEVLSHFDGKIVLHKVDIDKRQEVARSFTILSVPTLMLFKNGHEVWRMRGFEVPKDLIRSLSAHVA